ncbi:MAG: hypothetical protein ACXWP6_13545, partial [Ktedonobacterales bacterium]
LRLVLASFVTRVVEAICTVTLPPLLGLTVIDPALALVIVPETTLRLAVADPPGGHVAVGVAAPPFEAALAPPQLASTRHSATGTIAAHTIPTVRRMTLRIRMRLLFR